MKTKLSIAVKNNKQSKNIERLFIPLLFLLTTTAALSNAYAKESLVEDLGILELKSADTVFEFGGRINFTAYWNLPEGSFSAGGVPLSISGEDKELSTHMRNSRMWFKTRTPTRYGQLKTIIETDFHGSSGNEIATNSNGLRMRHAYLQLGGFTLGQNWSTFQTYVSPDILTDVAYIQWTRQPMVRWSGGGDAFGYDIALEQPETTLTDASGGQVLPGDDQVPDLIARLHYSDGWGKVAAAVVLRQIRQDQATLSDGTTVLGTSDSANAWGINLSTQLYIGDLDDFRFGIIHGDGIGRYIALNAYNAGTVDALGNIELQEAGGGYVAYRHWWSESLRSTAAYSTVSTSNNINVAPTTVSKQAYSYHVNLLWTPIPYSQLGIEYAYLEREQEDRQKGDMGRLYIEARYDF